MKENEMWECPECGGLNNQPNVRLVNHDAQYAEVTLAIPQENMRDILLDVGREQSLSQVLNTWGYKIVPIEDE